MEEKKTFTRGTGIFFLESYYGACLEAASSLSLLTAVITAGMVRQLTRETVCILKITVCVCD